MEHFISSAASETSSHHVVEAVPSCAWTTGTVSTLFRRGTASDSSKGRDSRCYSAQPKSVYTCTFCCAVEGHAIRVAAGSTPADVTGVKGYSQLVLGALPEGGGGQHQQHHHISMGSIDCSLRHDSETWPRAAVTNDAAHGPQPPHQMQHPAVPETCNSGLGGAATILRPAGCVLSWLSMSSWFQHAIEACASSASGVTVCLTAAYPHISA